MAKTDCVNISRNEEKCPCTKMDCERHGVCCECIWAHAERDSLPSCLRTRIKESDAFRQHVRELVN